MIITMPDRPNMYAAFLTCPVLINVCYDFSPNVFLITSKKSAL
jgi:hypothetical protein